MIEQSSGDAGTREVLTKLAEALKKTTIVGTIRPKRKITFEKE